MTPEGSTGSELPKSMDHQRAELEDRFRRVVEQLPAIVYLRRAEADPSTTGSMLYVGPQVESILGVSAQEWMNDPAAWARRFHPDDRARIQEGYRRRMRRRGRAVPGLSDNSRGNGTVCQYASALIISPPARVEESPDP